MPASTIEVPLSEPQNEYVKEQMQSGEYESPAAVIQNLLEQARLEAAYRTEIEAKVLAALHSDRPKHKVTAAFWEARRSRLEERLAQAKIK